MTYNIKAALGSNPLLWFIPIGEGAETPTQLYGGYEYYINDEKFKEYCKDKYEQLQKEELAEKEQMLALYGGNKYNRAISGINRMKN